MSFYASTTMPNAKKMLKNKPQITLRLIKFIVNDMLSHFHLDTYSKGAHYYRLHRLL